MPGKNFMFLGVEDISGVTGVVDLEVIGLVELWFPDAVSSVLF